jgi:hypothetical protein
VDLFEIVGKARYSIDIARQAIEFGCVTPFSHNRGTWTIQDGRMHLMTPEACASYTGGHAVGDQRVTAVVRPLAGDSHQLIVRAGGAMRGYMAGFDGPGRVSLSRQDFGVTPLATAAFPWETGRDYTLTLEAVGPRLRLSVDGVVLLEASDTRHAAGMLGCGASGPGRALYGPFEVEEL